MANPGFPGGPALNWDSLPVTPNGPAPTSGVLAQDKIIPKGVKHYLSTLAAPRNQSDRIPPDEFALMIETYNKKFGTSYPPDPMHPSWKPIWGTREAISRVATGRWNSFMCKAGKGHCPSPSPFAWIGKAIHAATKVIGKISKFAGPLIKIIPGIGNIASAIDTVATIGGQIVAGNNILHSAVSLLPTSDIPGFQIGAALMNSPNLTPEILTKTRAKISPNGKRGFDMAVSVSAGMATQKAPTGMSDKQKAGFYAVQGMQGATLSMQKGMLAEVTKDKEAKSGAVLSAKLIADKSLWKKIKEFVGFHDSVPHDAPPVKVVKKGKGKFGLEDQMGNPNSTLSSMPYKEFEEGVVVAPSNSIMSDQPYKEFDEGLVFEEDRMGLDHPFADIGLEGDSSVRSPTSTRTEVRSPTRTSTEVRSPTRTATSTEAYTSGNFTATVTGGAGAGNTSVTITPASNTSRNINTSKSKERESSRRQTDIDSGDSMNGDCHIGTRMNEGI